MKLRYTPRALAELDAILDYIGSRSPQGLKGVKKRVQATISLLLQNPEAGRATSRTALRRIAVRPYPYLIFYEATADEIIIHGLRHGARRQLEI